MDGASYSLVARYPDMPAISITIVMTPTSPAKRIADHGWAKRQCRGGAHASIRSRTGLDGADDAVIRQLGTALADTPSPGVICEVDTQTRHSGTDRHPGAQPSFNWAGAKLYAGAAC